MPIGQKIKMYYDPRGQVIRTVNPDLSEQRVVYGVPISLDTPGSFTPTPWETYTYDANDLADEWEGTGDSHVNSSHHYTPKSAEVDALGRTVKTMDRLESSNDTGNNVVMKYAYDIRGNLLEVKDAYDNIVFEHVYDLRTPAKEGESIPPLKTTHINKGTSTIVFDCVGKTVETRDAKGALTLLAYDTMQRPVDVWCRDNSSESVVLRQHIEYGTSAGDNSKGKLWKQYDEAGYQQINTYDFKGNVLEKFRQVILDSEILGTISAWSGTTWTTNPGPCYRVDWANPGSINTALLDTRQYQTNMQYDGLNRIKEITYPEDASSSRKILTPTYSKAGALRKITFDSTDYVKEIAYNAKGQRLLIAYGNDIMTRYVYDENTFRLLRLKTEKYTYSQTGDEHLYEYDSGTTKQDFAYLYDLSGNIVSINDETPESAAGGGDGLEKLFEYDALYRLLNATGRENQPTNMFWDDAYRSDDPRNTESYSQAYTYDLMGNIAELAHTANNSSNNFTREFSYGGNLLNSIAVGGNTYNFYFDTCGNMIQENSERFFEWDYADRMRLFYNQAGGGTEPSVISHYLYDAGGNRVKKLTRVSGGNWESITYIDGLIEYREDNVTNRGSISHVMDDTRRVATVRNGHDFGDSTPDVKYNLDDHLGSSGVLLDTSGTLVSREEYYPFGETSFGSYGKKRYRFCGKEKDEESGLYYYGARYYSPWTCRFISVDPLALDYSFYTPYQYAGNQPVNFIDLDGMEQAQPQTPTSGAANPSPPANPDLIGPPPLFSSNTQDPNIAIAYETKRNVVDFLFNQIIRQVNNLVSCPSPSLTKENVLKALNSIVRVDVKDPTNAFIIISEDKIFQVKMENLTDKVKEEAIDKSKDLIKDKSMDIVKKQLVKSTSDIRFDIKQVAKEDLIKALGANKALKLINVSAKLFQFMNKAVKLEVELCYSILNSGSPEYSHERFKLATLSSLNKWAEKEMKTPNNNKLNFDFITFKQDNLYKR